MHVRRENRVLPCMLAPPPATELGIFGISHLSALLRASHLLNHRNIVILLLLTRKRLLSGASSSGSKKAAKEAGTPLLAQLPHGAFHA